jgi:hypothetical protein
MTQRAKRRFRRRTPARIAWIAADIRAWFDAAEVSPSWGRDGSLAIRSVDACVGVGLLRRRDGDALLAVWRLSGPAVAREFFDQLVAEEP